MSVQSYCCIRSRGGPFARSPARIMSVTRSDEIVPALATVAALDFSLAVQIELASKPRFVQISKKLALSNNSSGLLFATYALSPSLPLKYTKKKPTECKNNWNLSKGEKKVFFIKTFQSLEAENRSFNLKRTVWSRCWKKIWLHFQTKSAK